MWRVLFVMVLAGCGRTDLVEDADGGVDGGLRPVTMREAPLFVAVEDGGCASAGVESQLKPVGSGERLVLMKTKAVDECSGAGGEYLVGTEVNSARDAFLGAHACYFLSNTLRQDFSRVYWGVTRLSQTAALFRTQEGWCITTIAGTEPVTTDSKATAWAVYGSETAARAALEALSQP
jgi:hypothetical protein